MAIGRLTRRKRQPASSPPPSTRRCMTSGSGICGRSAIARCTAFPNGRSFARSLLPSRSTRSPILTSISSSSRPMHDHTGVHIHWARDAAEHNRTVHGTPNAHGAKSLIKSKSRLTEEGGFRHYMASVGIEVIETDLGERIQQLDHEDPSHIVVPAVHKLRTGVAQVFAKTIGTDTNNSDVHYLAESLRQANRPLILAADAGMTGCNFAVAETGSVVVCTNEGNADLSANVPKLHIASIGIEKIIPRLEHLAVFVRLLSRSALGSPVTQYTSHFRGPREGGEMHFVL